MRAGLWGAEAGCCLGWLLLRLPGSQEAGAARRHKYGARFGAPVGQPASDVGTWASKPPLSPLFLFRKKHPTQCRVDFRRPSSSRACADGGAVVAVPGKTANPPWNRAGSRVPGTYTPAVIPGGLSPAVLQ